VASNYAAFDVMFENDDGTTTPAALETVHVYDATALAALADLTADVNGHIPAGTVTGAAGTVLRFWVNHGDGRVGYAETITT